jgi:hypothetical protein
VVLWDHVKIVQIQAAVDQEIAKIAAKVKGIVKKILAPKLMINAVRATLQSVVKKSVAVTWLP